MGMDEVLLASTAAGSVTTSPSCRNSAVLACSSSTAASMTRSAPPSRERSSVTEIRARAGARSPGATTPRFSASSRESATPARPARALSSVTSHNVTCRPARAQTSVMPRPIWPAPTTPTCLIDVMSSSPVPPSGGGRATPPGSVVPCWAQVGHTPSDLREWCVVRVRRGVRPAPADGPCASVGRGRGGSRLPQPADHPAHRGRGLAPAVGADQPGGQGHVRQRTVGHPRDVHTAQ